MMKKTYLLVLGLLCQQSFAQTRGLYVPDGQGVTHLAQQEKRIALVIGNKSYQHWGKLTNPVNDAHLMAAVLSECGFAVTELPDANKDAMINGIETFAAQISGTETVALFFYAGHGIEAFGKNYLIPTSDNSKCRDDLAVKSVDLEYIQRKLAGAAMTILVVDACRDNQLPFTCVVPNRPINKQGFAETKPDGIFIGFSTAPGTTALDGIGQKNSPYTAALAEVIRKSAGEEIESVFKTVRSRVRLKGQLTWHHSGYDGKFFFKPAVAESERDKDSDGDGIMDQTDQCPNERGPLTNNGCPIRVERDSDGDGIADSADKCPYEKGTREYNGCPPPKSIDSDGDGIPDIRDRCPNQFGEPEDGGCPNYTETELKAIAKIQEAKKTGADSLSLEGMGLKRLPSIIKQLAGLKKLDLSANDSLRDISALRDLRQLIELDLGGNNIEDLSKIMPMLRELKQLTTLSLNQTELNNISLLRELKQLRSLDLSYNGFSDLSALRELKQLTTLYLRELVIWDSTAGHPDHPLTDISALRELKQLRELCLADNFTLSDISALQDLKQLTWLDLRYCSIQHFNLDLNQLPNLTFLDLLGNNIQNLSISITELWNCVDAIRDLQKQRRK